MKITLNFDKTLSGIAGYQFGKQIYNEQLKNFINWSENVTIIFPNHITLVGISFVCGFFSDIVENWGLDETMKRVKICATNDTLEKNILKILKAYL